MRIKLLALMLGIMLLILLCSCSDNANEHIEIYSKDGTKMDNINIFLDDGYWVKDYSINYDNMQVVLNLRKDDTNG